jgi:hypothetical protein
MLRRGCFGSSLNGDQAGRDAAQVFAVSPVSDPSEAERRQDGSRVPLPCHLSTAYYWQGTL